MSFNEIKPGEFIWNRIMAPDANKTKLFYNSLFGWDSYEVPYDEVTYHIFTLDGKNVAGFLHDPGSHYRPHWMCFVRVENIEELVEKSIQLGASQFSAIRVIENVGKVAMIQDPHNALLGLFEPLKI
jgi:predicted enzyme related to lactoylglutathione lyase